MRLRTISLRFYLQRSDLVIVHGVKIKTEDMYPIFRQAVVNLSVYYGRSLKSIAKSLGESVSVDVPFDPTNLVKVDDGYMYSGSSLQEVFPDGYNLQIVFLESLLYCVAEKQTLHAELLKPDDVNVPYILFMMMDGVPSFNPFYHLDLEVDGIDQIDMAYKASKLYAGEVGKQSIEDKRQLLKRYNLKAGRYCLLLELEGHQTEQDDGNTLYHSTPEFPILCRIESVDGDDLVLEHIPSLHTYAQNYEVWSNLENKALLRDVLEVNRSHVSSSVNLRDLSIEYYPNYDEANILAPLNSVRRMEVPVWYGDDHKQFDTAQPASMDVLTEEEVLYTALAQYGYPLPSGVKLPWYAKRVLKSQGKFHHKIHGDKI